MIVTEAVIVILYIASCIIAGIITSRYVKTIEDFIVCGRRLGPVLVAFAFNSTALSGWLILGVSGWAYREGFVAVWTLWGSGMFSVLACYIILGTYIRRFSKITNSLTIPDLLEIRYYDQKKHIIRLLASIIIFISTVIYIGALESAVAKAFNYVFGIGAVEATIIAIGVVTFYCLLGGMLAAVWTDLIQGILMVITSLTLLAAGFIAGGGLGLFSKLDAIAAQDPKFILSPWQSPSVILYGISLILFASILSYMGQPQLLNKFMAARDDPTVRKASLISLVIQIILFLGVFVIGIAARAVWPKPSLLPKADTELVAPLLLEKIMGEVPTGILWAGTLAAVMSTADSLMVLATASIVNDIYYKVYKPSASQTQLVRLSRIVTVIIGILGSIIAFQPMLLLWSTWLGWSGLAVFVVVILAGLFWKRATREGAIAALIVSFIVGMAWFYFGLQTIVHITMPSLLAGFATIIVVSYLTKEPPKEVIELVEKSRRAT